MYAVIETGGKQYTVEFGDELEVELLDAEPGQEINLDRVLLVVDGDRSAVGQPGVEDAAVSARVLRQDRGEKTISFKYRPKARSRVKKGHRQELTVLKITDVRLGSKSAAEQAKAFGDAWETLPQPRPQLSLQLYDPATGKSLFFNLGPHPPRLWPQDLDLLHNLWLELSEKWLGPKLHHRDVIRIALRRLSHDVHSRHADDVVKQLKKEIEAEIRRRLVADRGVEAMAKTLRKPLPEDIDFMHASRDEMKMLRSAIAPLTSMTSSPVTNRAMSMMWAFRSP